MINFWFENVRLHCFHKAHRRYHKVCCTNQLQTKQLSFIYTLHLDDRRIHSHESATNKATFFHLHTSSRRPTYSFTSSMQYSSTKCSFNYDSIAFQLLFSANTQQTQQQFNVPLPVTIQVSWHQNSQKY